MVTQRVKPYLWATWLAPLVVGERSCRVGQLVPGAPRGQQLATSRQRLRRQSLAIQSHRCAQFPP